MSHNESLEALLNEISVKADAANSVDELIGAIEPALGFNGKLEYDNTIHFIVALVSLVLACFLGYFGFTRGEDINPYLIGLMVVFIGIGLWATVTIFSRKGDLTNLSDSIYRKNLLLDNGLEEVQIDGELQAEQLEQQFREFDRGNHERNIVSLVKGNHKGKYHSFSFFIYHFHYVDQRLETHTVSDGKGGTRTETHVVYDHYDRYGLICDFDLVRSIAILQHGANIDGINYRPASNEFNRRYTVVSGTELDAAKFLKPAVVTLFEDFSSNFGAINFEINSNGGLCLSLEDDDLLYAQRNHGIVDPVNFINELREITLPEKFSILLHFISELMRLTDSNFGARKDGN